MNDTGASFSFHHRYSVFATERGFFGRNERTGFQHLIQRIR